MTAQGRIKWAARAFGKHLFAMTSAGVDSALMIDSLDKSGLRIPVLHINTGFLPKETLSFRDKLQHEYGFQLYEYGPSKAQVADVKELKLWDGDLELYSKITKLEPLTRAIKELEVKALLTGVRSDQTANRAKLSYIGLGNDGEIRINPFLDWSKAKVSRYIEANKLPRNNLYKKGFESVGDRHNTRPGKGRSGREVMECGLHVINGVALRRASA